MILESEKLSIKVQDGFIFNAILSDIYRIFYDKTFSFLPFHKEGIYIDNFLKSECLKELNKRNIHEKILSIYNNNVDFFNEKYGLKEQQISSGKNNQEKGNIILEKIIDGIVINSQNFNNKAFLKKIAFGDNDQNIINCPVIVQSNYAEINKSTTNELFNSPNSSFLVKSIETKSKNQDKKLTENRTGERYFFDKGYFNSVSVNNVIKNNAKNRFYFEEFVSFRFDPTNFINIDSRFETFYYSCLNLGLFLDTDKKEDIVVNKTYFKRLFPNASEFIVKQDELDYQKIYNNYLKKCITDIRRGLRLVCLQSIVPETKINGVGLTNIDYINEEKTAPPFFKNTYYVENNNKNIKKISSFKSSNNVEKDKLERTFSSLEYAIVRDKSYVLYINEDSTGKTEKYTRRTIVPIVTVYSDEVINSKFISNGINLGALEVNKIQNFITNTAIKNKLKEKIMDTEEFKKVFEQFIPISAISALIKIDAATEKQGKINQTFITKPLEPEIIIANSIKQSLEYVVDKSLKDPKEY